MPRQLRIEYPGAMYHVMSRGNGHQDIFLDDVDRQDFLKTVAEAKSASFRLLTTMKREGSVNPAQSSLGL